MLLKALLSQLCPLQERAESPQTPHWWWKFRDNVLQSVYVTWALTSGLFGAVDMCHVFYMSETVQCASSLKSNSYLYKWRTRWDYPAKKLIKSQIQCDLWGLPDAQRCSLQEAENLYNCRTDTSLSGIFSLIILSQHSQDEIVQCPRKQYIAPRRCQDLFITGSTGGLFAASLYS